MIAYHGTNRINAVSIKRKGFKRKTYFAHHMEDALEFGGKHIFAVKFSDDPTMWRGVPDRWQFWIRKAVAPEAIVDFYVVRN
jgi:hypothetical protein